MKLTPLDLRKQQFKKKFGGGYDPEEVRGFIEKLATDWEDVLESQRQAESRVREMEAKLKHYEKVELALQEALDQARETTRRAEDAAERRSKLIIEEAELRAQRMLQDAEQERYNVRQDLVKLNSRQAEIAARLRAFLMSEMEVLAHFQGEDTQGFLKLMGGTDGASLPGAKVRLPAPVEAEPPEAEVRPVSQPSLPRDEAPSPPAEPPAPPIAPTIGTESAEQMPANEAPRTEPRPSAGPRRFTRPVPVEDELEASVEADVMSDRTPSEPVPDGPPSDETPTYQELLSRKGATEAIAGTAAAAESTDEDGNPFSTPFFQSPFFKKEDGDDPEPSPSSDAAQGWSLRSLVTGDDAGDVGSVVATDDERERIRRILNDLD